MQERVPDRTETKISIIILTYNRSELVNKLLSSLVNLEYKPLEIIVVDNASDDDTENIIRQSFKNTKYIRLPKNIGAGARNQGMKEATGDIIVTLDDDIFGICGDDLRKISKFFLARPMLGALNFKIIDHKTNEVCNWVHHRPVAAYIEKEFLTYEITEGAVAFRRKALLEAGYYPEIFFLSHEGPDLALRILDAGYDVVYSSVVTVRHLHSNLGRVSWLNYYYDTRNQFWLAARNFPLGYSLVYLGRGLSGMLFFAIRDGHFMMYFKGIIDAFVGLKEILRERKKLSPNTMVIIKQINKSRTTLLSLLKDGVLLRKVRL